MLTLSRGSANGWIAAGATDISAKTGATRKGVLESGLSVAGKERIEGLGGRLGNE